MKTYFKYYALCLLLGCQGLNAQSLGQDAEGYSSIITPTATFNLDLSNDLAVFAYYDNCFNTGLSKDATQTYLEFMFSNDQEKMERQIDSVDSISKDNFKHRYVTWGADFKGSLSNGTASIFNNGSLASSGGINALVGFNWDRLNFKKNTEKLVIERLAYNKFDFKTPEAAMKAEVRSLINAGGLTEGQMAYYADDIINKKSISKKIEFIKGRLRILENLEYNPSGNAHITEGQLEQRKTLLNKLLEKSKNRVKLPEKHEEKVEISKDSIIKIREQKEEIGYILDNIDLKGLTFKGIDNPYLDLDWKTFQEDVEDKIYENKIALDLIGTSERKDYKSLIKFYKSYLDMLKNQKTENNYQKELSTHERINRHLVYVRAGLMGSSFKYDYGKDSTTVASRFRTRDFDGYKIDIGYTGQYNLINYVGLGASVGYMNNVDDLSPATFTLTTKDTTITSGDFTSSQTVKALSGLYDQFVRYDLNVDFVRLFRLKPEREEISQIYISLNPYLRHRIYQHSETLRNRTIFGIGAYAYSSKDNRIMGGLFLQNPDVFGNNTPLASTFGERIQFGLVARFGFKGLNPK